VVKLHIVLTLVLGGVVGRGEWSVTCLGHFTSGECDSGIHRRLGGLQLRWVHTCNFTAYHNTVSLVWVELVTT
jgi:hypothetical protein